MHSHIVGQTEAGKGCLAKQLAQQLIDKGQTVAVLEPLGDKWPATYQTDNVAEFDDYLRSHRNVYAFIDECGDFFDEGRDKTYAWFATRSRHYGHSVCFISQRVIQLPRTMRDQCQRMYVFTSSADDGAILANEWNKPILAESNTYPQFTFYVVSRFDLCKRMKIEGYSQIVEYPNDDRNNREPRNTRRTRGNRNAGDGSSQGEKGRKDDGQ